MREALLQFWGEKVIVTAKVEGHERTPRDTAILLSNVCVDGVEVADHLWVDSKKKFPFIEPGMKVIFRGKVRYYYRIDGSRDMTFEVLKVIEPQARDDNDRSNLAFQDRRR